MKNITKRDKENLAMKNDLKQELKNFRSELKQDITDLKVELLGRMDAGFGDISSKLEFLIEQAGGDRVDVMKQM